MFGTRARAPRPVLLLLVYGAFLAIVGVAATAQSVLVGAHFSTATLTGLVGSDAATIRAFVNAYVRPTDLSPATPPSTQNVARLEAQLATLPRSGEILRVELRRPDGTIVAASDPALNGVAATRTTDFQGALDGTAEASLERMANQADKIKEFLGGPIFDKLKSYCSKLGELKVRGATPATLMEDETVRKSLYVALDEELEKTVPIVIKDPVDAELRLKAYLTHKLA